MLTLGIASNATFLYSVMASSFDWMVVVIFSVFELKLWVLKYCFPKLLNKLADTQRRLELGC